MRRDTLEIVASGCASLPLDIGEVDATVWRASARRSPWTCRWTGRVCRPRLTRMPGSTLRLDPGEGAGPAQGATLFAMLLDRAYFMRMRRVPDGTRQAGTLH